VARFLRFLFFLLLVRPLVLIVIGLNIRNRQRLPTSGPALIVANHNSHLDTLVLISLFPLGMLSKIRPAAAADYFLKNSVMSWFSRNIIGIVPVLRSRAEGDPLAEVVVALERKEIVIFFPEGTRGDAEVMATFKSGIALLSQKFPNVPVYPIFLHGLGKALPKGEAILVPFFCDVFVGEGMSWSGDKKVFLDRLQARVLELSQEGNFRPWE
jgi:1-acyl-sn-glycerol-3-phosphate acyltransferase